MGNFDLIYTLLTIAGVFAVIMTTCAYLIWLERKISAWMQDRVGPNRVGPAGLLQPLADGLKFILKEDIIPPARGPDTVCSWRRRPCWRLPSSSLGGYWRSLAPCQVRRATRRTHRLSRQVEQDRSSYQFVIAPGLDIGIVFVFAISSLAVYGIILGGWASNNKYSFIGALRSSAQIVSYEIPLGLSILGVVLLSGSLNLERIIAHQAGQRTDGDGRQPRLERCFSTAGVPHLHD